MFKQMILALALLSPAAQAEQLVVEVFHDNQTRLFNTQMAERLAVLTVYDLSAPEKLEELLSQGLSDNPEIAKKQANERLKAGGIALQDQLMTAYAGSMKAMSYDIQKLPAVVFNHGEQIIYGVADVNKAIQIYMQRGTD